MSLKEIRERTKEDTIWMATLDRAELLSLLDDFKTTIEWLLNDLMSSLLDKLIRDCDEVILHAQNLLKKLEG